MNFNNRLELKDHILFWKVKEGVDPITKMWNARFSGRPAGCIVQRESLRYVMISIDRVRYYAHRIIWEMSNGPIEPGYQIDHIDGDGLNNNITNLRPALPKKID